MEGRLCDHPLCFHQSIDRHNEADPLTEFLEIIDQRMEYEYWFFGHFHDNRSVDQKHILLWEQIVQIL